MSLRSIVHQIHQLLLYHVVVVQFEYPWGLEYQTFNYLCYRHEIVVFFVVTYQLQEHLRKKETVLVGLRLADQETLVAKRPFSTYGYQKLYDVPQTWIIVSLRMKFLKQIDHNLISAHMQGNCIIFFLCFLPLFWLRFLGCSQGVVDTVTWRFHHTAFALEETFHV